MSTDAIFLVLKDAEKPLSTNEIAKQANVDWHTAHKHLHRLVEQGKIYRSEISNRLTLYWDREIPF